MRERRIFPRCRMGDLEVEWLNQGVPHGVAAFSAG